MKLCFNVAEFGRIAKANGVDYGVGKKKQQIVVQGKYGTYIRNQTVGRKNDTSTKRKGEKQENNTSKDGRFTVGDIVSFEYGGKERTGKVLAGKGDVIVIAGQGDNSAFHYPVKVSDVKDKIKNADGTIPASKFNANDYKKAFTDSKCTPNAEGMAYVYSLLGNEEGRKTQAEVEAKLTEQDRRMKNGDTRIRNMHNVVYDEKGKFKSGEWNDDRKKLHDAIMKIIFTPDVIEACKPKNGEKPKFVMFGGRGGSGKSWFTDKEKAAAQGRKVMFEGIKAATGKDENNNVIPLEQKFDKTANNFLILDADALKESLPEYKRWNAGEVHEESSYLNKEIKKKAMELGLNIIIDGTMNYNKDKPDKVRDEMLEAKDRGYGLEAHYMFLPLQDSCIRAFNRFKTKKGDYEGRLVPTKIMLEMQDNEKSFDSIKDIVDDWSFRDNRGEFGPKLISKKGL